MPQPQILVTGATGNVGAAIVEQLIEQGYPVRAATPHPERVRVRFNGRAEAAHLDFGVRQSLQACLQGIDSLFLMRPPAISNVRRYLYPLVDLAKQAGVRRVVFLSLLGVERNRLTPHYRLEQYLTRSGLPGTFLRASYFMQNFNTVHRQEIRFHNQILVPVGKARTSFVDVRDIAAVAARALTEDGHQGCAYELTGGQALDYHQVAELFSQELGRKVVYNHPSVFAFMRWRSGMGERLPYILVQAALHTSTRFGMAEQVTGQVEQLLGRPPLTLQQYIHDYRGSWDP